MTAGRPAAILTLVMLMAVVACRTARPAGNEGPVSPLAAPDRIAAFSELQARRAGFTGARSLMRIRATAGDKTQSFRAQLQVDRAQRMQLTAYTPVGTTALTLFADGDRVIFLNAIEQTAWTGSASEFARSFGFFGSLAPSEMAMLLLGLPARSAPDAKVLDAGTFGGGKGLIYDVTPTGLSQASIETDDDLVVVHYDPPAQPPQHVSVDHGAEKLEIEHLEIATSDAVLSWPGIPSSYRCCVVPRLQ
ncbi:MAG: hypothetical protein ABI837_04655 [Acidobacteriota bacterium]